MKKAKLFFGLTIAIFLLGLAEAVSGFVLWLAIPGGGGGLGKAGGGRLEELTFWELSKVSPEKFMESCNWALAQFLGTGAPFQPSVATLLPR